jgi:hypothetical protein
VGRLRRPCRAGLAGLLALGWAAPALAQSGRVPGVLPPLEYVAPEDKGGRNRRPVPELVDKLADVVPAIGACWRPPSGLRGFERAEVTARFSLRRDGSLIGSPRTTYATGELALNAREMLTRSVVEAIAACTPVRISASLGNAMAGRMITIHFIYRGPRGRGA